MRAAKRSQNAHGRDQPHEQCAWYVNTVAEIGRIALAAARAGNWVDGLPAAVNLRVSHVQALGADWYGFSGHKL